ncbi:MAG: HAMP domain-containing histidine kinase [Clostridia bacterium]|nr:HAMP domain-containing histidine kinase [Clostridia bacterium]
MGKIALRNFLITALTILVCITVFSSLLLVQLYQYSVNEKFHSLETDGYSLTELAYIWKTTPYRVDTASLENALAVQALRNDTRVMITDHNGNIEMYADPYEHGLRGGKLDAELMERIRVEETYTEVGTLAGYYRNHLLSVALPIVDDAGFFRGAVIISAPTSAITQMFSSFFRAVTLISIFVLALAAAIIYFVSQKFTRPIKDMATAARSFSRGDFSARVRVSGRDEVAELARSFNSMAESLAKLESLRSEFIANVSHELKTPMTTIGGFVDGIIDGTIPPEREQYYLGVVSSEIQRLSRLVQKLLLATRLQSGKQDLNITNVDISSVVTSVALSAEQAIEEKHLEVDIQLPETRCFVRADADAITQVVTNLIDNAVKYADEGGRIAVSIIERGNRVFVSVFNTGRGISKDQLPFIFDRFYKTDRSRGMDKASTGLGLYIVKSILNNLGQEIVAESEYGKWARFTFTLDPVRHTRLVSAMPVE